MSTAKHTPGPWHVAGWEGVIQGAGRHAGTHAAVWGGPNGELLVCPTGPADDAQSVTDAHLIAAAPDLLAVCKRAAAAVDAGSLLGVALAAAIAKARGE